MSSILLGVRLGMILFSLIASLVLAEDDADFVRHPMGIKTFVEAGQLVSGRIAGESKEKSEGQTLQRSGLGMDYSSTYQEKLDLRVSMGGIFWYTLPESDAFHERIVKGGFGLGELAGVYHFQNSMRLQFGLFGEKYNGDAKNLGEYLFRSGTYPGLVYNGGFELLNTAGTLLQGIQFEAKHFNDKFTHSAFLYMERAYEPNYDWSGAYLASYQPIAAFELGAGINFSHFLPARTSKVTPKGRTNAYDKVTGMPLEGDDLLALGQFSKNDPAIVADSVPDLTSPGNKVANPLIGTEVAGRPGVKYLTASTNGTPTNQLGYYTFQGIKVMGKASFSPLKIMETSLLGADDLKLYAEIAVLGWKNYPFYYEKRTERMPIMVGFNLPTFKLLDVLSVEIEKYQSPFPDNAYSVYNTVVPVWYLEDTQVTVPNPANPTGPGLEKNATPSTYKKYLKEKWANSAHSTRWTVFGKRTLNSALAVYGMAASDHTHPIHFFGNPDPQTMNRSWSDWYYALRLETKF
jgi:hypothetical protein